MQRNHYISLSFIACFLVIVSVAGAGDLPLLKVAPNKRYLITEKGIPFFWLGDTGWLLLSKLNREEISAYFKQREKQGFNVVQVMLLHSLSATDVYGDSALQNRDVSKPNINTGVDFIQPSQYDYWDNVDYAVKEAARHHLYMALVPVWGTNVKEGGVSVEQARAYATFLAHRYKNESNIIWMNGGDIEGSNHADVWNAIGETLFQSDKNHLITYHPRGRRQSGEWFNKQDWLSFNMVQSGHKDYTQDTLPADLKYGEDNWRYIEDAYHLQPEKPVLDAEPSYEGIPHGLHDTTQSYWVAADVRRYAYWSLFAGAFGFTYGHNAVMQFLRRGDTSIAFGAKITWQDAMTAEGAKQMQYVANLITSVDFQTGKPAQNLIIHNGERYNRQAAFQGRGFAFVYTCNGNDIEMNMKALKGKMSKAFWYNPRTGEKNFIAGLSNRETHVFHTPGEEKNGNDWVLILTA